MHAFNSLKYIKYKYKFSWASFKINNYEHILIHLYMV